MVLLCTSVAVAGGLPRVDRDDDAILTLGLVKGRTTTFREQARATITLPGEPPVTHARQRTLHVTVDHVTESGGAQVRVSGGEGSASWLVDEGGSWHLAQVTSDDAAPVAIGGTAPTVGSFVPPKGPIAVGHTWEVPISVHLDHGSVPSTLSLTGTARWQFVGWAEVHGEACPILTEAMTFEGSHTMATHVVGVAGERASEVCWDVDRGEAIWQQVASNLVMTHGDQAVRLRVEAYLGRVSGL